MVLDYIEMKIGIISHLAQNYKILSDITFEQNKRLYSDKYGYTPINVIENTWRPAIGFDKIKACRKVLTDFDFIWYTPTDGIITNFQIDIADVIKNVGDNKHFIITSDRNGLNSDSYIVKNSPEGNNYLDFIISQERYFSNHVWFEQQAIIQSYEKYKDIIEILPQKILNSYDYSLYGDPNNKYDKFGNDGQWQVGDLLVHWPGTSLQKRIELANYYLTQVIK